MSDLTNKEQRAVRLALRFLRFRAGAWKPLGKALGYSEEGVRKAATGQHSVTPTLALRVARFAGVGMDDVLSGQWLSGRVCPHCGHPPDDVADEDTVTTDVIVTDAPRVAPLAASAGWKSSPGSARRSRRGCTFFPAGCTSIRGRGPLPRAEGRCRGPLPRAAAEGRCR